jgi:hypothetical protein
MSYNCTCELKKVTDPDKQSNMYFTGLLCGSVDATQVRSPNEIIQYFNCSFDWFRLFLRFPYYAGNLPIENTII